jgi:hypothetical protein
VESGVEFCYGVWSGGLRGAWSGVLARSLEWSFGVESGVEFCVESGVEFRRGVWSGALAWSLVYIFRVVL